MSVAFLAAAIITIYDAPGTTGRQAVAETGMSAIEDVGFACRPSRVANKLQFDYRIENRSGTPIYALDLLPSVDPGTRTAHADPNGVYVSWIPENRALILKGIAPLPQDRTVAVRVMPLGTPIAPGATLERTTEIPLPLAEHSPYYGELPLRQYEQVEVVEVIFAVQFLRSTVEGFGAVPVDYAPGAFHVQGRNTVGQVETLSCGLPTKNLPLLKRTDNFTRQPAPAP